MTATQLDQLARSVEAHFSPAFRAQLLEADLALANALRELVELERAKFNSTQIRQALEAGTATKLRTTLYPLKRPKPGADPSFVGSFRLAGRSFDLKAWIGPSETFINLELAVI
jgi:hypothetical protein